MRQTPKLLLLLTLVSTPVAAQYAGSGKCATCHGDKFALQSKTGHAQALAPSPAGRPGEWAFGAGAKAITYVSQVDSETYLEHGLSYYSSLKGMAPTPGHSGTAGVRYPIFDAEATTLRCFRCHSTGPLSIGSTYQVEPSELGVHCEACHGAGAAHVAAQGAAGTISNPKQLTAVELNDLCGTCHRPAAEEDWTDAWKTRHQPAYLSHSTCFRKSEGALSCVTCHDPHAPLSRKTTGYDARCSSCHRSVRHQAAVASKSCVQCHMPQVKASAQIEFTNHWIGIYRTSNKLVPSESRSKDVPPVPRSTKPAKAALEQTSSLLALFEQGLAQRERESGASHLPINVKAARNAAALGLFLSKMGRHVEAEGPLRKALEIDRVARDPLVPADEENLAIALDQGGRRQEAFQLFQQAAAGPDAKVSARCLTILARLDPEHEVDYYKRALAAEETAYGPDNFKVAVLLNNLALALQGRNQYDSAEALFRRALSIQQHALGAEHPACGSTLSNLGTLLQTKGDLAEAERLERTAIRIFERTLGPASAELATACTNLADVLWAKKDLPSAGKLYLRAISIDESVYGLDHPEVAADLVNLGLLRKESGERPAALQALRRALSIYEKTLGPNSREALRVKKELEQ